MSEWRDARLEDLCERITVGFVGKMADQYMDIGIPFLRSQNIQPFRVEQAGVLYIGNEFHERIKKSTLRTGDVAVVRTGYPGTAAVIPSDLNESNCADLVVITPSADLNPHFLAAVFNSAWGRSHVGGQLVGSAQQHFNVGSAKAMEIRLPDRSGQDRIADVLCSITDLIENNRRRIEVLEEMAQAIYREWFVHFRYPGHEDAVFVDSPLGHIPEGWEVAVLGQIATLTGGNGLTKAAFVDSGHVAFSAAGPDGFLPTFDIDGPGVVMSAVGARCGRTFRASRKWSSIANTIRILPKSDRCAPAWLFLATSDVNMWPKRGSAQPFVSINDARLVEVVSPTRSVAQHFQTAVGCLYKDADVLADSLTLLEEIRDLLLPKLVTGEIDVSELDLDALVEATS